MARWGRLPGIVAAGVWIGVAFDAAGQGTVTVRKTGSACPVAAPRTAGSLRTGQPADLMLSGVDFNRTGGALLFSHPGLVASDGTSLLLADRSNNRVLVWTSFPARGEEPPDFAMAE